MAIGRTRVVTSLLAWGALLCQSVGVPNALAEPGPAPRTYGWRGNWTGLYPDADPPTRWQRRAKGVVSGMLNQAGRPGGREDPGGDYQVTRSAWRQ